MVLINYWAVLVSGVLGMIIGGLWYSPAVFGKMWMTLSGLTPEKMEECKKKGMTKQYVLQLIAVLVMTSVLACIVRNAGAITLSSGLYVGFYTWLGFIAPVTLGSILWEGKPWKLWLINNAHYLIVLLISGAILAIWS